MSPPFVLRRENVPCVAEVVNRSLKADFTDFTYKIYFWKLSFSHCSDRENGLKTNGSNELYRS